MQDGEHIGFDGCVRWWEYTLDKISNATVFKFKYFISDITYQAYFFRVGMSEVK